MAANETIRMDDRIDLLVYNRIPKTGSGSLMKILDFLNQPNNYTFTWNLISGKIVQGGSFMTDQQQVMILFIFWFR